MKRKRYHGTRINPTHAELLDILSYDAETGIFYWRVSKPNVFPGKIAGSLSYEGYQQIAINDKLHRAHRLAWFYTHGIWPTNVIDHIDGNRLNNALANLRDVTQSENLRGFRRPRLRVLRDAPAFHY